MCTLTNIQVVGSDNLQRTVHHLNAALHRVVWKPTRSNTSLNPSRPYGCTMNGISFRLSNPMQLQHRDGPCIHAKFNGAFISGNLKGMPTSSTPFSLILAASNTMYCCCIFAGSRLTCPNRQLLEYWLNLRCHSRTTANFQIEIRRISQLANHHILCSFAVKVAPPNWPNSISAANLFLVCRDNSRTVHEGTSLGRFLDKPHYTRALVTHPLTHP